MDTTHDKNSERSDFVKEMYGVYWSNISRSMEGVWKVLAPVTVVGTIMVGIRCKKQHN